MEWSIDQVGGRAVRPKIGKALEYIAAALLFSAAIGLPDVANAEHGGGFHGGGFHGGGFHGGGFHHGFGGGRAGFAMGWCGLYAPYAWDYYYPCADTYSYPDYGYDQAYPAQYWYYCSDPAGYYPYVTQCNTGWQTVPAS
jgi:hypothetical protein